MDVHIDWTMIMFTFVTGFMTLWCLDGCNFAYMIDGGRFNRNVSSYCTGLGNVRTDNAISGLVFLPENNIHIHLSTFTKGNAIEPIISDALGNFISVG